MDNLHECYQPRSSYIRVATARPEVVDGDVTANRDVITDLFERAEQQDVSVVVFPELSLSGYSLGDTVRQSNLIHDSAAALSELAGKTRYSETAMVVGLPLQVGNGLYNCAAVLAQGEIKGIVPKQNLPNYGEFYEKRWYQSWKGKPNMVIDVVGNEVPFGNDLLFDIRGAQMGIEICEDLWVTDPPSRRLAEHGALLVANPSASPETIGKAQYRRQLVGMQAARLLCGYIYAGCDSSESTSDVVMSGHQMINAGGQMLAERKPFERDTARLLIADIDMDHLRHERIRDTNFPNDLGMTVIKCVGGVPNFEPRANVPADPFLPANETAQQRSERLSYVLDIAATGLAERMRHSGIFKTVLGLSGGLDSTLALLISCRAAEMIGKKPSDVVQTLTMPGMASTSRTQLNAQRLAEQLGVANIVVPIDDIAEMELKLLAHSGEQDVTYQNVQARARTELLFNYGNLHGGLVQGTGDLSEAALGFATYNGDHMSHYNPNATIPKTLVRHLVSFAADLPEFAAAKDTLRDIVDTPVSPELTRSGNDEIDQKTEDIIGPYQLHEFFLTYLVRWGDSPSKVRYMAEQTFAGMYDETEIHKWFDVFTRRFVANQFKRSAMPDGPNVGSVSLNPKANWRMPSDFPTMGIYK